MKVDIDGALNFFVDNKPYPTGIKTPTGEPLYVVVQVGDRAKKITILELPRAQCKQSCYRHGLMCWSTLSGSGLWENVVIQPSGSTKFLSKTHFEQANLPVYGDGLLSKRRRFPEHLLQKFWHAFRHFDRAVDLPSLLYMAYTSPKVFFFFDELLIFELWGLSDHISGANWRTYYIILWIIVCKIVVHFSTFPPCHWSEKEKTFKFSA